MEQKYTWAQIAGQVGAFMNQYRAMAALQDMMNQAAQAENYLNNSGAVVVRLEEELAIKREALSEVAQEYVDLHDLIKDDKAAHKENLAAWKRKEDEAQREYNQLKLDCQREHEAYIHTLNGEAVVHETSCEAVAKELEAEIATKRAQLDEVKEALARLKEML
jgi:chromosome segregation ATPase